jgi:hypothetical protein
MMRRWRSRVRADRGDGAVRLRIAAMVAFEATIRERRRRRAGILILSSAN